MALYLSESEVAELLSPREALDAIEACFIRLARGVVENRTRTRISLEDGVFAYMAAADRELGLAGVKTYTWLPGGTPFVVVLFDLAGREARGRDRGGQARPATDRCGERHRGEVSCQVGRSNAWRDRLRLASGVAGRVHSRGGPRDRPRRRLLPL